MIHYEAQVPEISYVMADGPSTHARRTTGRGRNDVKMTIHLEDYTGDIRLSDFVSI